MANLNDQIGIELIRLRKLLAQAERENNQGWSIHQDLQQMKNVVEHLEALESQRPKGKHNET